MLTYSFDNTKTTFFAALKERVAAYFTENNIHQAGNRRILIKSIVLISIAASLYCILVFFTPVAWLALLLCVVLGFNLALIGFNVMHDGGHQSFSRHSFVNKIAAHFLNVLGGTAYYWQIKHNINHHTYTNVEGLDSDIDVKPFMRLHADQPFKPYHRFQHIYCIALYGISYVVWVFYEDFQKYFSGRINSNSPKKKLSPTQHLIFWMTKLSYIFLYIIVPIALAGWLSWLVGFLIITFVCGLVISIVFQLAHVVEGTHFHSVTESNSKSDWARHQIQSTANFNTRSRLLHWLLGGLNFQIEHHLFPRVSHIHYPAISKYVKEICLEHGVIYKEYKSVRAAVESHLKHLYRLGRPVLL